MAEQGLPSVAMRVWSALDAPKGMLRTIVERVNAALRGALNDTDFQHRAVAVGQETVSPELATLAGARDFLRPEIATWAPLSKTQSPVK